MFTDVRDAVFTAEFSTYMRYMQMFRETKSIKNFSKGLVLPKKSNARKRAEIKAEITPDYLNFLKALKRKRKARNVGVAVMLATSMVALISAAFMRNSNGK